MKSHLRKMSRPIRQEKKGCRMIGQATTRIASKPGNCVLGNEIAAACSGYSPKAPPTALILALPVCRSLQVAAISGLMTVTDAPVSISAVTGNSGKCKPIPRPSSNSNRAAVIIIWIQGPPGDRGNFTDGISMDQIDRLLCSYLLHEELAIESEFLQSRLQCGLVIIKEPGDIAVSDDHE